MVFTIQPYFLRLFSTCARARSRSYRNQRGCCGGLHQFPRLSLLGSWLNSTRNLHVFGDLVRNDEWRDQGRGHRRRRRRMRCGCFDGLGRRWRRRICVRTLSELYVGQQHHAGRRRGWSRWIEYGHRQQWQHIQLRRWGHSARWIGLQQYPNRGPRRDWQ